MVDVVDAKTRSRMMANIGGKDTRPELVVRCELHRRGFRYRLNDRRLPGRPDIVLPRLRAVIFVHGCFWHRHPGCRLTASPRTRPEFWSKKFGENVTRDQLAYEALLRAGWRVAVVWECATRSRLLAVVDDLAGWLRSSDPSFSSDSLDPRAAGPDRAVS